MATSENRTDHAADDAETVSATNIAGGRLSSKHTQNWTIMLAFMTILLTKH